MIKETTNSLKEYFETLIENNDKRYEQRFGDTKIAVDAALIAADKAVAAALAGQKEAVSKAEAASEKRFASVNEFRATLSDQQRLLLPRLEAETKFDFLIKMLEENKKEIGGLRESRSLETGKDNQGKNIWSYVIGAVGIASTVILLVLRLSGK